MAAEAQENPNLRLLDPPAPPESDGQRFYKVDDDILARDIAEKLKGKVAFFHSQWKVLERGCWTRREPSEVRRFVREELCNWRDRGVSVTQNRIKALTAMLEDDLHISDRRVMDMADSHKRYINLRNGLFNLETMQLEPHNSDLYFTAQLDFEYDEDAYSPTWNQYLNSSLVFPDGTTDNSLTTLVQEALGYSLTARTDLKSSFWLVGAKDSGKSTMIAFLKLFLGSLHGTIDLNQLATNRFLLGGIVGKRVITFTEAETNTVLPDALYKALVGGSDEIYADVKNRDPVVFTPEAKIWWAMNGMPRVTDRSGATMRRIYIFPFNRSIPAEKRISNLEQRLYAERAGIFNALINHYKRVLHRPGFSPCAQSDEQRRQYAAENDTEATYVSERCETGEGLVIQSILLYADYKLWCEDFGFKPKNSNQIAAEWRRLGFRSQKNNVVFWQGVALRK